MAGRQAVLFGKTALRPVTAHAGSGLRAEIPRYAQ